MNEILYWGLGIVHQIQGIRTPFFDQFFRLVSELGTEIFYLTAVPLIWWNLSAQAGMVISLAIFASVVTNMSIKDLLAQPRPFHLDPTVGLAFERSHGAPSGHAQQSIVFWGLFSLYLRQRLVWVFSACFVFLIAFSRLYLGVHFPTDIFLGWFLGICLLAVIWLSADQFMGATEAFPKYIWPLIAFCIAGLTALATNERGIVAFIVGICGLATGMVLAPAPSQKQSLLVKITSNVLGLAGLAIIYVGLKKIMPGAMMRYFLCGLWISCWPKVSSMSNFIRLTG